MNVADFKDWVNRSKKGKRVVYGVSNGSNVPPKDIMESAHKAMRDGRVLLIQRRSGKVTERGHDGRVMDGDNRFDYIAVKV